MVCGLKLIENIEDKLKRHQELKAAAFDAIERPRPNDFSHVSRAFLEIPLLEAPRRHSLPLHGSGTWREF